MDYKGEDAYPVGGIRFTLTRSTSSAITRSRPNTTQLTRTHTFTLNPETWDPRFLSHPFVTSTANLSARARELELDVGTFSRN